ncbi:MAG: FAD binding domain-containing protein, partial [Pseudomonadota bacterium]
MTPAPFDYVRAQSLDHAIALKAEHGSDASILAGGQSLVPLLTMRLSRPAVVVDIGHLKGHDGLWMAGGMVRIGPLTRHRTIERDATFRANAALLADAAHHVA